MLDLKIAPLTRTVWASEKTKAEWGPRLAQAASAWSRIERDSVAEGLRPCAQQWVSVQEAVTLMDWARQKGLSSKIMRLTAQPSGGFVHTGYPAGSDMAVVAVGINPEVVENPIDNLGYPPCCIKAFSERFPADADPVLSWGTGGLVVRQQDTWAGVLRTTWNLKRIGFGTPLLRYLGVRAVAHIPCQNGCLETERLAQGFLGLMRPEEREAMEACLSLPLVWDRYRGVVLVTTEHFLVVSNSQVFANKEVLNVA